ncbi:MAG: RNA-binding protein [Acidobacteriota bacterium]|jgi:RNA recognition motif-containing protein|nr:RNA-binding protein [Acidobacteriota bacterium]
MSVRLFVGNLPYDATETELRDFFSSAGTVSAVIIPVDRETGKRRGFAFVEFGDPNQAAEASRRLNNQPFRGRNVTINEARARENSGGAPRPAQRPRFTPAPKPSLGTPEFSPDMIDNAKSARAENRRRNFGADAKPAHKRKAQYGGKGETASRKGPIRERGGGQIFGEGDDEDSEYDYLADFRDSDAD